MRLAFTLFLLLSASALAQNPTKQTEFPEGANPVPPEVLQRHLTGPVFKVMPADGSIWRLEYKDGGYVFIDVPNRSYRDSGKWQVDGTKLCSEWKKVPFRCAEARMKDGILYVKQPEGEVLSLIAQ